MAEYIRELETSRGKITMIYAPLRGAKPIVDSILEQLRKKEQNPNYFTPEINFPVTSSFVLYPTSQPYATKKGKKPASGRTTNILELKRIMQRNPRLLSNMLYIDEIVSGGMMQGHVREMIHPFGDGNREGVLNSFINGGFAKLNVLGMADADGKRFGSHKQQYLQAMQKHGRMQFAYFPVKRLVTEDNRYLLGQHFLDYALGPHQIPFVGDGLEYNPGHSQFWKTISS
jgi:hypothetical protein